MVLADRTTAVCKMISSWHNTVVCPSYVCPSVTLGMVVLRVGVGG